MSKNSNSNCCSEHSFLKQRHLIRLIKTLTPTLVKDESFLWVELNGGAGKWKVGDRECLGSPLIAHELFKHHTAFNAFIMEPGKERFDSLSAAVGALKDDRMKLVQTTNERAAVMLHKLKPKGRGVIYYDPGESPLYHIPVNASLAAPTFDVLAHVAPGLTKRCLGRTKSGKQEVDISLLVSIRDYLDDLGKAFNYITDKDGLQQWVMVYSTDDANFVPPDDWMDCSKGKGLQLIELLSTIQKDQLVTVSHDEFDPNNPSTWENL